MDGSTPAEAREQVSLEPEPRERRQYLVCAGVTAEAVCMNAREPIESRYCGPFHLLIAHERLARRRGMTMVDGVPESNRQILNHTLTFVPAGRRFREWGDPDVPSRVIYIHIDPQAALVDSEARDGVRALAPRLHFQSVGLWHTVLKVKALVESGKPARTRYAEALGAVLAHELLHSNSAACRGAGRVGLTAWQRRRVAQYIDDHLADEIPVAKLAELARLSRHYFCRSFRQSFGVSPHRYHSIRRMERAKSLLGYFGNSITDVALDIGFRETSSFTTAFRKLEGQTPTTFRRSLLANRL
jgi:AraC family transcriptional regulator